MSIPVSILCLFLPIAVHAGVPQQPQMTAYSRLWTDSPFTAKPPPPPPAETVNPFEGYSLGGVSRVQGGYFVILLHDKEPEKKVTIVPGQKSDWQILEVKWSDTFWRETTVRVRHGGREGTLAFDEAQLTLAAAPKAPAQQNPNRPPLPGAVPGQPNLPGGPPGSGRGLRNRVVVPPPSPGPQR